MNVKKAAGVLVAAALTVATVTGCGHDEDQPAQQAEYTGTDIGMTDPQGTDVATTAQGTARLVLTWTPQRQDSVYDLGSVVASKTAGHLAALISDPSSQEAKKNTPSQWADWAAAQATVKGFVDAPTSVEGNGDQRTVTMKFTQRLQYPDGTRSEWATGTVKATMTKDGDVWSMSDIKRIED